MQTIEYRDLVDRKDWPSGPWDQEPDKRQWVDPATGLACMFVRNNMGALCGYVGVPPTHPDYGSDYADVDVSVHGGLTFAGKCQEDGLICHRVEVGEDDDVWWLGFDMAHWLDVIPQFLMLEKQMKLPATPVLDGYVKTYKTVKDVEKECTDLAAALFARLNDRSAIGDAKRRNSPRVLARKRS